MRRTSAFAYAHLGFERRVGGDQVTWAALDTTGAAVATALAARPGRRHQRCGDDQRGRPRDRPDEALAANRGPHLAAACVWQGAPLLHVSTDYVFPGTDAAPGPYGEGAAVGPVNHYGRTKLEGERAVEAVCAGRVPWLVARTALVYGHIPGGRGNFVSWLAGELRAGRRVRVVDDQWNTPTLADDLAAAVLRLLARGADPRRRAGSADPRRMGAPDRGLRPGRGRST
jgi:nucleoside-diphosphate-sugar epimerase